VTRIPLFNRRAGASFEVEHFDPLAGDGGATIRYHVTIGQFKDGSAGETFIMPMAKAGKGSMLEAIARDAAILLSFALQHGASPDVLRRAMTRDEKNQPQTFVGAVLDAMEG
jgi:hypothetical protein